MGQCELIGVEEQGRAVGDFEGLLLFAQSCFLRGDCVHEAVFEGRGQRSVFSPRNFDFVGERITVVYQPSVVVVL